MLRRDGRLVLIGSTAGQRGEAYHADYAAAKGAMGSFVKSFCIELAPRGITVNCVAPGWVDTEMSAAAYQNGGRERIAASIPIGRIATADDVAGPVVFLCSELGRHVTGEILTSTAGRCWRGEAERARGLACCKRGLATLALAALLVSCGDGGPAGPPPGVPSSLSVVPASVTLTAVGQARQLQAEVRDAYGDVVTGLSVTWTTSRPGTVAVDGSGLITAIAAGDSHGHRHLRYAERAGSGHGGAGAACDREACGGPSGRASSARLCRSRPPCECWTPRPSRGAGTGTVRSCLR